MDFEDIEHATPTQELDVAPGREVGEYTVKSVTSHSTLEIYSLSRQNSEVLQCFFSHTIFFRKSWQRYCPDFLPGIPWILDRGASILGGQYLNF